MSCLGIIFATKFAKIRTSIVVLFQFDPYNVPFYISTNPTIEYKCLRILKLIIKQLLIQPRKPGSFTSARRYSKDPGALWSRDLLKIRTTRGPRGGWLKCDML